MVICRAIGEGEDALLRLPMITPVRVRGDRALPKAAGRLAAKGRGNFPLAPETLKARDGCLAANTVLPILGQHHEIRDLVSNPTVFSVLHHREAQQPIRAFLPDKVGVTAFLSEIQVKPRVIVERVLIHLVLIGGAFLVQRVLQQPKQGVPVAGPRRIKPDVRAGSPPDRHDLFPAAEGGIAQRVDSAERARNDNGVVVRGLNGAVTEFEHL